MRMVLMTEYTLNTIPFKTVYLHGLVRDAAGRKMSKSLGNNLDPLTITEKFGADAARMALVVGNTPGTDMRMSEDKIRGYKNFANKLWNIARFILENTKGVEMGAAYVGNDDTLDAVCEALAADITRDIEEYRVYMAAEKIYHYAWHELADKVLEESKPILASTDAPARASRARLLLTLLDRTLRLLHPFMPFVTEEIYQSMPTKDAKFLMVAKWPEATKISDS
jgi:valyl-tRNA synthetase